METHRWEFGFGEDRLKVLVDVLRIDGAPGRVVHGEVAYSIKSDPRVWDTVPATSHVEVLLVRVR